jgi:hypothetical protein
MNRLVQFLATTVPESIAPSRMPSTISVDQIRYVTAMSALQVFTALLLHLTIFLGFLILMAVIFKWRRTALILFILFGTAVLLIPSGYCLYYGCAIVAVACAAFIASFMRRPVPASD